MLANVVKPCKWEINMLISGITFSYRHYLFVYFQVIFSSKSSSDAMKSISMPFYYMKNVEVKQPVFGANALAGLIKAQPNGE